MRRPPRLLLLVLALLLCGTDSAACGDGRYIDGDPHVGMDKQVINCPNMFDYMGCCNACGSVLDGWGFCGGQYCEMAPFNAGVYLKGGSACPSPPPDCGHSTGPSHLASSGRTSQF